MRRFWDSIVKQVFIKGNIKSIVEIGSDQGGNTANLLQYVKEYDGHLYAIDPFPSFPAEEWAEKSDGKFTMYRKLSLEVLPELKNIDAFLIDGDHNWYTVYNELKAIKATHPDRFPLILFHDIGWPYARRDLYYNPENIPPEYRQPYEKKGIKYGMSELSKNGINRGLFNAINEGTSRNGVRTAVEDFLNDNKDIKSEFYFIDAINGLGMIASPTFHNEIIEEFYSSSALLNLLSTTEKERINLHQKCEELKMVSNRKLKAKIYLDYGNGFNENDSILCEHQDEQSNYLYKEVILEKSPKKIRIKPCERAYSYVTNIVVSSDKGLLSLSKTNGIEISDGYFFDTFDPQLVYENIYNSKIFTFKLEVFAFTDLNLYKNFLTSFMDLKEKETIVKSLKCDLKKMETTIDNQKKKVLGNEDRLKKTELEKKELINALEAYKKQCKINAEAAQCHTNSFRYRIGTMIVDSSHSLSAILKEPLIKSRLRLGTHLACIFSVISHINFLTYDSMPTKFLCNLTKNLTAQSAHRI